MIPTVLGLGLLFLALLALGGWAVLKLVGNWIDQQIVLAARQATIDERRVALEEARAKGPVAPAAMPPDLIRRINNWMDVDARDQERKILLDLFNDLQDWDKVRAALPVSPSDEISDTPAIGLVA